MSSVKHKEKSYVLDFVAVIDVRIVQILIEN